MNQFLLPSNADLDQWGNFLTLAVFVMGITSVGFFILYATRYYKRIPIQKIEHIYLQHRPWIECIYFIFLANIVLDLGIGLLVVADRSFEAILNEIGVGLVGGLLGFLFYWIISWFGLTHPRVKYVPFLKRWTIRKR